MTRPYLLLVRSSSSSIGGFVMPSGWGATPDTCGQAPQSVVGAPLPWLRHGDDGAVNKPTNSSAALATWSLTTTRSNSPAASSSACAIANRRSWTAAGSEPRPASRLTSADQDGGARNTSWASG